MGKIGSGIAQGMLLLLLITAGEVSGRPDWDPEAVVPSHADAAVIFAKYSGLFDRYVPEDATLNECVAFLNGTGIYFGLLEIVNESDFTLQDCARVMGQMNLVFAGEAEYVAGKVKLPEGIDSWEEFCILNDVRYVEGYGKLGSTLVILLDLSG